MTWLLTIATNVWRNRIRDSAAAKRAAADVTSFAEDELADPASDEELQEQAIDGERRRLLKAAIDDLPPRMRRSVLLRVYQGMSFRDVADILGVTTTTAKSQVSRARARLRESLAEHYPELVAESDDQGD